MEILKVKTVLITSLVLLHFYVQPVVANSTVSPSTAGTSTIQSNTTTMPMTILQSTESPSTANGTSSTVAVTIETSVTSTAKLTSSVSSSTPETTTQSAPITTMTPSTTIMTSTVLPSASKTTLTSTMSPMDTTVTPNYMSPTMTTAAMGKTETIVIGVAGGVMLLVLTIIAAFCIYKKCCTDTRPLSKLNDDDDFTTRMSMHRPDSSTMNADGDLAFLTFTGMHNEVDGVVNPTYNCTVIETIPEGSATIPSKARLTQTSNEGKDGDGVDGDRDVEGAADAPETEMVDVASEPPAMIKQGEVRPISGVSYKSEDIDLALETLDIGTV